MTTPKSPSTVEMRKRERLAHVILDVENEKRLQEIQKAGGLADEAVIYVTLSDLPRVLDWHTDKCRCTRFRYLAYTRVPAGTFFKINVGDRIPRQPSSRPATREEIAQPDFATVEDAAEYAAAGQPVSTAEALRDSVRNEADRARREVEAAARRVVDLDAALSIAGRGAAEAQADFEKFFEGRPAEFRTAVANLAQRLATPPAPQPEDAGRTGTLDDIRRSAAGATASTAFKIGASGRPVPLHVSHT